MKKEKIKGWINFMEQSKWSSESECQVKVKDNVYGNYIYWALKYKCEVKDQMHGKGEASGQCKSQM